MQFDDVNAMHACVKNIQMVSSPGFISMMGSKKTDHPEIEQNLDTIRMSYRKLLHCIISLPSHVVTINSDIITETLFNALAYFAQPSLQVDVTTLSAEQKSAYQAYLLCVLAVDPQMFYKAYHSNLPAVDIEGITDIFKTDPMSFLSAPLHWVENPDNKIIHDSDICSLAAICLAHYDSDFSKVAELFQLDGQQDLENLFTEKGFNMPPDDLRHWLSKWFTGYTVLQGDPIKPTAFGIY